MRCGERKCKKGEGEIEGRKCFGGDKGEEVKKRGRPKNVERLTKKRTRSMNSIMDLLGGGKRKEREQEEEELKLGGRKRFLREVDW